MNVKNIWMGLKDLPVITSFGNTEEADPGLIALMVIFFLSGILELFPFFPPSWQFWVGSTLAFTAFYGYWSEVEHLKR